MKKILLFTMCFTALTSFGQKHIEELSYEDSQNSAVFREIRNNTTLTRYIAVDGSVLTVGDTLKIGEPSQGLPPISLRLEVPEPLAEQKPDLNQKPVFQILLWEDQQVLGIF